MYIAKNGTIPIILIIYHRKEIFVCCNFSISNIDKLVSLKLSKCIGRIRKRRPIPQPICQTFSFFAGYCNTNGLKGFSEILSKNLAIPTIRFSTRKPPIRTPPKVAVLPVQVDFLPVRDAQDMSVRLIPRDSK